MNRYNIYTMMLRAAAGEGGGGSGDDGSDTSNAPAIHAGDADPDDAPPSDGKGGDAPADGDKKDDAAAAGGDGAGDPSSSPPPVRKPPVLVPRDAILKRVGDLTSKNKTLEAENQRLKAEAEARTRAAAGNDGGEADSDVDNQPQRSQFKSEAEFQEAVKMEARRQLAVQQFNAQCDEVAATGAAAYKDDWNESVANLRMLSDDGEIPMELLQAALASDDPAKVLHELGQDPLEAQRVMGLPPVRMIAEVAKRGVKVAAPAGGGTNQPTPPAPKPKPRSAAPDPIEPIGGGGGKTGDGLGDDVSDEDWYANRQKQIEANARAARG